MKAPAGQRIFTRSSITNEEYEYFIPSTISNIESSSSEVTFLSSPIDESAHLPNAIIVVSRGKPQLSIETLDQARTITALLHAWRDTPLDIESIARLHAFVNGGQTSSSTYRDSLVWVDGVRPSDAKLVTGAASTVLPLMRDYIAFIGRGDIDITTKLALGYYQILMIHPFFDGNGRLSRMLALLQAKKMFGTSRAFAIAAVLSLHRRALRKLLDPVREGRLKPFLAYWARLVSWSEACVAQLAALRVQAIERIATQIAAIGATKKLVSFLVDKPLFSQSDFSGRLRSSDKLTLRYIENLMGAGIIEQHQHPVANDMLQFRCPVALGYWRQAIDHTTAGSKTLLAESIRLTTTLSP